MFGALLHVPYEQSFCFVFYTVSTKISKRNEHNSHCNCSGCNMLMLNINGFKTKCCYIINFTKEN